MSKLFNKMYDNYNYPLGADTPDAPWNQIDPEPEEIEVTVSVTLSKTFKINVDDYESGYDQEIGEWIDFDNCDLNRTVKEQITLPQDAYKFINNKYAKKDLEGWNVDEMEIIKE